MSEQIWLWLGLAAIILIGIIAFVSQKFKANLSKGGLSLSATQEKDQTTVEKIEESNVNVSSPEERNISIRDVKKSAVTITK